MQPGTRCRWSAWPPPWSRMWRRWTACAGSWPTNTATSAGASAWCAPSTAGRCAPPRSTQTFRVAFCDGECIVIFEDGFFQNFDLIGIHCTDGRRRVLIQDDRVNIVVDQIEDGFCAGGIGARGRGCAKNGLVKNGVAVFVKFVSPCVVHLGKIVTYRSALSADDHALKVEGVLNSRIALADDDHLRAVKNVVGKIESFISDRIFGNACHAYVSFARCGAGKDAFEIGIDNIEFNAQFIGKILGDLHIPTDKLRAFLIFERGEVCACCDNEFSGRLDLINARGSQSSFFGSVSAARKASGKTDDHDRRYYQNDRSFFLHKCHSSVFSFDNGIIMRSAYLCKRFAQ